MTDWEKIRKDFAITDKIVYFQSAGMSPLPKIVFDTVVESYREIYEYGDIHWQKDCERFQALCRDLGEAIHTKGDNISFVQNTSTAMSLLGLALSQKYKERNFHILSMMDEFPATTVPFEYLNIPMKYVKPTNARYPLSSILELVDAKTLAVVTSYVQYCTGFRQNLEKLGMELKERRVLFIVNATQAFPMFPVDVEKMQIDAMTVSLHKWGFAGHVGAMLYTSKEFRNRFEPPIAGWLSIVSEESEGIHTQKNTPLTLQEGGYQYMPGTINLQVMKGLQASLQYLQSIGWDNIRERIFSLGDYLYQKLQTIPVHIISPKSSLDERSAIVVFNLGAKTKQSVAYLEQNKIYVGYRKGNVRVSLNIFNSFEEIDRLIETLRKFI